MEGNVEKLEKLSDEELEKIVLKGTNIHISISEASVAKRILENRRQHKQVEAADNMETVVRQFERSNEELLAVVSGMGEVISALDFLKKHWFPKTSIWVKVISFILTTIFLGLALNIFADWVAKFIFHW